MAEMMPFGRNRRDPAVLAQTGGGDGPHGNGTLYPSTVGRKRIHITNLTSLYPHPRTNQDEHEEEYEEIGDRTSDFHLLASLEPTCTPGGWGVATNGMGGAATSSETSFCE